MIEQEPFKIRIFPDHLEVESREIVFPLRKLAGQTFVKHEFIELPPEGLELEVISTKPIETESVQKSKTGKKKKETRRPKKATKKILTTKDAILVGSGQLPGDKSPREVYKKDRSYYLRKGKSKTLIPASISEVLYNRILATLTKYLTMPAEFSFAKETLTAASMGVEMLMKDEFDGLILVAQAKGDIVIETEGDKKMIKLKE